MSAESERDKASIRWMQERVKRGSVEGRENLFMAEMSQKAEGHSHWVLQRHQYCFHQSEKDDPEGGTKVLLGDNGGGRTPDDCNRTCQSKGDHRHLNFKRSSTIRRTNRGRKYGGAERDRGESLKSTA